MGKIPVSRIADLRQQAGMTQRELAIALDVTESTVRNYEKGRHSLKSLEIFVSLCRIFDCKPEDLLDFVDPASDDSC